MEIFKHINWVDIVLVAVGIRIVFMAMQTGFVVELMNLLAAVAAVFVAFHYYTAFAGLAAKTPVGLAVAATLAFMILLGGTFFVCWLVKNGLFMLFTIEAQNALDKWGAAVLALGRVAIVASFLSYGLVITGSKYLQRVTLTSVIAPRIIGVAPTLYEGMCDRVVDRLFPQERKNPAVLIVMRTIK